LVREAVAETVLRPQDRSGENAWPPQAHLAARSEPPGPGAAIVSTTATAPSGVLIKERKTMPRKKGARTAQQKKFKRVAQAANKKCHRDTNSVPGYKVCMSREMRAGLGKRKKRGKKK
jgi:hypothetical protein